MAKRCEVCALNLHDDYAYQGHIQGKKHLKNLEIAQKRQSLVQKSIFVRVFGEIPTMALMNFFSSFGKIVQYRFGNNYLIIEYDTRQPVDILLSNPIYYGGRKLDIKRRILHEHPKNKKIGSKEENNKGKEDDFDTSELCYKNIRHALEEKTTFDDQLTYLLNEIQLNSEDVEKLYEPICSNLDDIFRQVFPRCKAFRFGSTVSGLGLRKSDLDIYMDIKVPINDGDSNCSEWNMRKVFTEAKRLMYRRNVIFGKIIPIPRAKMPIIKFCHIPTNISCDLSFKNSLGLHNSRLIKYCLSFDNRLKPTMMLIKYWAKELEITRSGRISNYSLVMLFIFYLQQPSVNLVPPAAQLQTSCAPLIIEGWQVNFDQNWSHVNLENINTIPELLQGFFEFYANFNFNENVICPLDGIAYPKTIFQKLDYLPESMKRLKEFAEKHEGALGVFSTNRIMCVQDPIELSHNITMSVSRQMLDYFHSQCKVAANVCNSTMKIDNGRNLLPKLFTCTESFKSKKTSQDSVCQIVIPANEFLRVGLPPNFDERMDIPDKEQFMRENWYSIVRRCVRDIFEKVLKLQIQTYQGAEGVKQQKVDATSDVHSCDHDKFVFCCTGSYCLWRERRSKRFVATAGMSLFEREVAISDAILRDKQTGENYPIIVNFTCSFERTQNPDSVTLTFTHCDCSKTYFRDMISYLKSKLATLVCKIMREMPNEKKVT